MYSKEIIVPEGVSIQIEGNHVRVTGPNGELEKSFKHFFDIKIEQKDNKMIVSSDSEMRKVKAMVGTIRAHLRNMFYGVTEGHIRKMRIVYSHFPMNVKVEGERILINNFLGEKVPRVAHVVGNTGIEVKGQDVLLKGTDKEAVGQTMANIETACKINKYDRRVFQDGIYPVKE